VSEVTVLTQADCAGCGRAKKVLADLAGEFGLVVREVDVAGDEGRALVERHRLPFSPGVIYAGQLVAYGRISKRGLRRRLAELAPASADRR